ncbi:MAG: methyltransferase domain-containing protein [Myxococcales bacterium]|nr:methyltransferase domain-containing protein [Myxococcales bacterium]
MSVYAHLDAAHLARERQRLDGQAGAWWAAERTLLGARLLTAPRGTLLDLGCGTGATAHAVADAWPGWRVIGVDADARMGAEPAARVTFRHAPAGAPLPLPDASVDAVYGRFLMQHVDRPAPLLAEVRRVLRPGGRALLLDVDDRGVVFEPRPPTLADLYARAADAQRAVGGDRHVGAKLPGLLLRAGLVDVDLDVVPITGQSFGLRPLLAMALGLKGALLGEDAARVAALADELCALPGFVALIPLFVARGVRP